MEPKEEVPEVKKGKMFLLLPGIEGLCTEVGYEGCLIAETVQWGVGVGVSSPGRRRRRRRMSTGSTPAETPAETPAATGDATATTTAEGSSTTTTTTATGEAASTTTTPATGEAASTTTTTATGEAASTTTTPATTTTTSEAASTTTTATSEAGSSTIPEAPKEEEPPQKRTISSPSISEVTMSLQADASAPLLFHATSNRQIFPEAVVTVINADGHKSSCWRMKEVVISGFSISQSGSRAHISTSFNFNEIELEVCSVPPKEDASAKGKEKEPEGSKSKFEAMSHRATYNMLTEKALLDGETVPSNYVEPEGGDDDDYW